MISYRSFQIPNLGRLEDLSEFLEGNAGGGNTSGSEVEDDEASK